MSKSNNKSKSININSNQLDSPINKKRDRKPQNGNSVNAYSATKAMKTYRFPDRSRYILGAYFNLARLNLYKTIMSIFAQTEISGDYEEDKILKVLDALYRILTDKTKDLDKNSKKKLEEQRSNLTLKNEQKVKLQRLLFHQFPMLGPIMDDLANFNASNAKKSNVYNNKDRMSGVGLADCLLRLKDIAACLINCRNYYTHYRPYNNKKETKKQFELQGKVALWLDKTFTASRRIDKSRNDLSTFDMEFLTGNKELQRYQRVGKKFVERENFYFKITKKVEDNEQKEETSKITVLSDFGVVYFCSLFLQKNYAQKLLEEVHLFDKSPFSKEENNIVFDMMCIYRIRIPQGKRMDINDSNTALGLDIINELNRCPRELYEVLSEEGKAFFTDIVKSENNWDPEEVKRIRYTDRFPQLVMRYIDFNNIFSKIRFQVRLGNFRFHFYNKVCIDGSADNVRSYQKEINGFGRLQEIEESRKKRYAKFLQHSEAIPTKLEHEELYLDIQQFEKDTAESTPYITNHQATYNIHTNRIGLYWQDDWGKEETDKHGEKKQYMYFPMPSVIDGKAVVSMPAPRAELSLFDFPAMMFYHYLYSNLEDEKRAELPSVEEIIIQKTENLRKFFDEVKKNKITPTQNEEELEEVLNNNYKLRLSEIPTKLHDYLTKKKCQSISKQLNRKALSYVHDRYSSFVRRKDNFKRDKEALGNKDNKYGKKGHHDVRHGRLADFLAQSIMEWLPANSPARARLTGMNYSKLQAFLATYGQSNGFDSLETILRNALVMDSASPHPFIKDAVRKKPMNIESLYTAYLNAGINYIKMYFNVKDTGKDCEELQNKGNKKTDWNTFPFVHSDRERWKQRDTTFFKGLASRYLQVQTKSYKEKDKKLEEVSEEKDAVIFLPDGLFTPYIMNLLSSNKELKETIEGKDCVNNAAFIISSYFKLVLHDNSQPYYYTMPYNSAGKQISFTRTYNIFNVLKGEKNGNELVKQYLTLEEIKAKISGQSTGKDKIRKDINIHCNNITMRGNYNSLTEAKEAAKRNLQRDLKDALDNERTIRRYKTQDMVLFLMAKDLLKDTINKSKNKNSNRKFRLENVCKEAFLNQTVDFSFPVTFNVLDEKDNKEKAAANGENTDDLNKKRTVTIVQNNLSLKNYGKFYRFINDARLPSLLRQLGGTDRIDNTDLSSELTSYDNKRSMVFKTMQSLEKLANHYFKDELDDFGSPKAFIDNDNKKGFKRNNFRSLLYLLGTLDAYKLSKNEIEALIQIRNAFCHNNYRVMLNGSRHVIPEVATEIILKIDNILADCNINL